MKPFIRSVSLEDASRLLEIYSYYTEHTAITFETEVPSLTEFERRICTITEKYPYLVLESEGTILGYAYAGVFKGRAAYDHCVETTIYIAREAVHSGYGRLLYEALENELKTIGILNLYACIGMPADHCEDPYITANSAEFHAHMGYTLCGTFHRCGFKFNRWYDMIWMEKMIGAHISAEELHAEK